MAQARLLAKKRDLSVSECSCDNRPAHVMFLSLKVTSMKEKEGKHAHKHSRRCQEDLPVV